MLAVPAVTSTTAVPDAAASSSRSRDTPGRSTLKRPAPHWAHTTGRCEPQREHRSTASSGCATAASHTSQRAMVAHDAQASSRARPVVLSTQATRAPRWMCRSSVDVSSDVAVHGASRLRSTTSRIGQPARSSSRDGAKSGPHPRASSVGAGDTSTHAAPARRARSATTSRACHVGARSSCNASSCSSSTTAAARPGTGAHAAALAPTTTSAPAAATAQSRGCRATDSPARRRRPARSRAWSTDGVTTSVGPRAAAASTVATPSPAGGRRTTARPAATAATASGSSGPGTAVAPRRRSGRPATTPGGEALARSARTGPAQRQAAHSASSSSSGAGPHPVTLATGFRITPRGASPPSSTTQPPTRRPWSGTRTMVPTRTRSAKPSGTT